MKSNIETQDYHQWGPNSAFHGCWQIDRLQLVRLLICLLVSNPSHDSSFSISNYSLAPPIEKEVLMGKEWEGKTIYESLFGRKVEIDYLWISVICALHLLHWITKDRC